MHVNRVLPWLVVRADTSAAIGVGHIMRCIALAQAWRLDGGQVTFLSKCENEALRRRIRSEGFEFLSVDLPHPDPADHKLVNEFLQKCHSRCDKSCLVLDGYHFGSDYQNSVRKTSQNLVIIDDYNHLSSYHADIILNQNIGAESLSYNCDPDTVCLLGTNYTLLRTEFIDRKNIIEEKLDPPRVIMVTLGGADPNNITLKVVQAMYNMDYDDLEIDVLIGPTNPNAEALLCEIRNARKSGLPNANAIRLLRRNDIPQIMERADVAVSAGGSTCWELCLLGIPFLIVIAADNQYDIAVGLDQAGAAICLGRHHEVTEKLIEASLENLLKDNLRRREMSVRGRLLVDGKGRLRVIKAIADNFR